MLKILIVDDMKDVHLFLGKCFTNRRIECDHAFDGREAIQAIERGNKYDLIILDWEMPTMNGPSMLIKLKKLGCQIPVIMLTSTRDSEKVHAMLELGVKEYLHKPVSQRELLERIQFVLKIQIEEYAA